MGQSKNQFMSEREHQEYAEQMPTHTLELTGTFNLAISKANAAEFHKRTKEKILSGRATATEYVEVIKFFGKLNEEIFGNQYKDGDKEFRKVILDEISQYGKEMTTPRGVKYELAETGTKYDYSNNPAWVELDKIAKQATEDRKALEDRLKAIPAGKMLIDADTGETLIGPSKSSNSSFKITLPK